MDNSLKYRLLLDEQRADLLKGEEGLEDYFRKEHTVRPSMTQSAPIHEAPFKALVRRSNKPTTLPALMELRRSPLQEALSVSLGIAHRRLGNKQLFTQEEREAVRELYRTLDPTPASSGPRPCSDHSQVTVLGVAVWSIGDTIAPETADAVTLQKKVSFRAFAPSADSPRANSLDNNLKPRSRMGFTDSDENVQSAQLSDIQRPSTLDLKSPGILKQWDGGEMWTRQSLSQDDNPPKQLSRKASYESALNLQSLSASGRKSTAALQDVYRMLGPPTGGARRQSYAALKAYAHQGPAQPDSGGVIESVLKAAAEVVFVSTETSELMAHVISSKAVELTNADKATLYVYDAPSQRLSAFVSAETGFSCDIEIRDSPGGSKTAAWKFKEVFSEGTSIEMRCAQTSMVQSVSKHNDNDDVKTSEESVICIPIRGHDGSLIAVLKVISSDFDFSKDNEAALGTFGLFCGGAISSGKMTRHIEETGRRLTSLLAVARTLSDSALNTSELSRQIIGAAQDLVHADRCALFLMQYNDEKGADELVATVLAPSGILQKICVPLGVGIAGFVGQKGEPLNIPDAYADARFNSTTDKQTGYTTKSILCIPVRYGDRVVAVAQLVNKTILNPALNTKSVVPFTADDVAIFDDFAIFAGVNLYNAMLHEKMLHEKRKQNAILDVIQKLNVADVTQTPDIIKCVMTSAKQLGAADRCALFLVDKETNELYTTVDTDNGNTKVIRIPRGAGVAGWVATNGKPLNIKDAYEDPRFSQAVDKSTGYHTETILCMPVFHQAEVIAVTQLVNKRGGAFTREDEEVLVVFSEFAAMTLRNAQMFDFMREAEAKAFRLLTAGQGGPTKGTAKVSDGVSQGHVDEYIAITLTDEERSLCLTPDFPIHGYNVHRPEQHVRLVPVLVEMFRRMDYIKTFHIDEPTLYRFLIAASRKYRQVPYHNFTHAFDVTQTLMVYIKTGNLVPKYLSPVDAFVLVVCGICHDIDHMGVNNSFHFKADTPLAVLSSSTGSRSVLEIHHCNIAIDLLSERDMNVFSGLPPEDTKEVWKTLINAILATDMARHGEVCDDWAAMMARGYAASNKESARLMASYLLKCADISNISKPFEISKTWGQYVTAEFSWEGGANTDKKSNTVLDVSATFHCQRPADLAKGQVGFMEGVGLPMYSQLAEHVPELKFVVAQLQSNLKVWKENVAATT